MTSVELFKQLGWGEGEVLSTKEVAQKLKWPVKEAYATLSGMAQLGQLDRYGYRIAPGVWADEKDATAPKKSSLHWQRPPSS
jgi:hypothetical protein